MKLTGRKHRKRNINLWVNLREISINIFRLVSGDRVATDRQEERVMRAEEPRVNQNETFDTGRLLTRLSAAEKDESEKKPVDLMARRPLAWPWESR